MELKNYQYNKILMKYDERRRNADYDLKDRTAEAYEKIPQLKEINNQIIEGSVNRACLALQGDDSALKGLAQENAALSKKKVELLIQNGYPADYLELHYICPDCQDTGFINNKKCKCFNSMLSELIYDESNISCILHDENFDTFRFDLYDDSPQSRDPQLGLTPLQNMQRVVQIAREFVNNFDYEYKNLLIMGNTGVGKTFLSNCIAKSLLDSAHSVLYLTAFQFYDILEAHKFKSNDSIKNTPYDTDYIYDCDLLILDDLGTELLSSFTVSELYACINERLLGKKSTIISTNLTIDRLEGAYGERIVSRLIQNYILLKVFGDDIRLK